MFLAKKLLGALLAPLPLAGLLLVLAAVLLWRRPGLGRLRWLVAVPAALIWLLGTDPLPEWLIGRLEAAQAPVTAAQLARWRDDGLRPVIVVLGGGHGHFPHLPAHHRLGSAARARLMEGVRLYHALPGSRLLLSGGNPFSIVAEAEILAAGARSLNVPDRDLLLEDRSQDTADQARFLAPHLAGRPFLLVTSAAHMPRALALFRAQGLHPVPAPAHFQAGGSHYRSPTAFLPQPQSLQLATWALHEYLGLIWYRLTCRAASCVDAGSPLRQGPAPIPPA